MSAGPQVTALTLPLLTRQVRAYFAPVDRVTGTPTVFDPALAGNWIQATPPFPWRDLGWVTNFSRTSESVNRSLYAGLPNTLHTQTREKVGATVSLRFGAWSKVSMALTTGAQHMNVLAPASAAGVPIGSGGNALSAVSLTARSSDTVLYLQNAGPLLIQEGGMVVVDDDYTGQTGYVGAAVSGAYVQSPAAIGSDADYIRRISFNVGRVAAIGADGELKLASPLPAGAPKATMKLQQFTGFVDRVGGTFFQEWSGLFVCDGLQGDRLCFYYPRLQGTGSLTESWTSLATPEPELIQPQAAFVALPVSDGNDGEQIVCYRSYFPSAFTLI